MDAAVVGLHQLGGGDRAGPRLGLALEERALEELLVVGAIGVVGLDPAQRAVALDGAQRRAGGQRGGQARRGGAADVVGPPGVDRLGGSLRIPAATFAHVLIATDMSANALNAAIYGIRLYGTEGNRFTLLNTFRSPPTSTDLPVMPDPTAQLSVEGLESFAGQLLEQLPEPTPDLATISAYGALSQVLQEMCEGPEPPDLVVMGTHGTSGLERLLMGSTTASVIRNVALPVLAVPAAATYQDPQRIVLADDGGPVDRSTLKVLLDIARWSRSEVMIVHVVPEGRDAEAQRGEPLGAGTLHELEVVGVVHDTGGVGVLVVNADREGKGSRGRHSVKRSAPPVAAGGVSPKWRNSLQASLPKRTAASVACGCPMRFTLRCLHRCWLHLKKSRPRSSFRDHGFPL